MRSKSISENSVSVTESNMSGDDIIASLRGIISNTTLSDLSPDHKAAIRKLLAIIDLNVTLR